MKVLSKGEVKKRIKRMSEMPGESDLQHCMESGLYHEFINNIVNRKYKSRSEIINVAKEIIKSNDIEFRRWFV